MEHLYKIKSATKEIHTIGPHNAILNELDDMLRELDREIVAYGQTRSLSLEVLKDLLEEDRASRQKH